MPRPLPELPDARAHTVDAAEDPRVRGWRCTACDAVSAIEVPWCPVCRKEVQLTTFAPRGTVWSSTVFRVPLGERRPPWALAYVDLDDGPRVLVHLADAEQRLRVGSRIDIIGETPEGDILAREAQG